MLPIPIFLILVFSVAILAPAPAILIHIMKSISLPAPPSHFPTMPALPSTFLPPAKETLYIPVPGPQPTLDIASVCRDQSIVDMTLNSTKPPLQAHEASGYTTPASTVLPVVVLAMVNCLVYKLLVDDTNGTRPEEEPEQLIPCQPAHLAPIPSEESTCYYTIYEIPSPRPVIDTNILTTGFSENNGLSDVVTASCLELGHGVQSSALFEQSSQFLGSLSYGALAGDSGKVTTHDSSLATLSVSDCTSCDDWTQTAHSMDPKEPSSAPIPLVAAIKYSELVLPQCVLDTEAVKADANLSSAPLSREPELELQIEPQDNSTVLSDIESACDVNDVHEAYLSYDPEDDNDDEAFDYKGIDWEPRISGVPTPLPSAEIDAIALPYSSPSKADHESTSWYLSASALSMMYASDDIQVGVECRNEARISYNTRRRIRRASADDLRGMGGLLQVTPFPDHDSIPVASLHNSVDKCISINQVALLMEDLPILTSRASAISEEGTSFSELPQPAVFAGLKASVHAPRNDDLSGTETEEYIGTLNSKHTTTQESPFSIESQTSSHSPKIVSTADEIQESAHIAPKPSSHELSYPETPASSTSQASRVESPTVTPAEMDVKAIQTHKEPSEIPVPPAAHGVISSNAPRGLAASMHAPQGCLPSQVKTAIAVHLADAPNWAAAAREDSAAASRGSSSAQRGKTPNQALDDGDKLDVPTASRCAIQDENEEGSGIHDSDGSMHTADDQDGAAGSCETDSGLDAADDSNEQGSATRSRRSRCRGKPRRPRTKVPYLPPPRMRNLTQHPAVEVLVGTHKLTAGPAISNGQHHSHMLPQQPGHLALVAGSTVPPQAMASDQLRQPLIYHQTLQQHIGSPSMTDHLQLSHISSLPAPYYPILYTQNPHGERAIPLRP